MLRRILLSTFFRDSTLYRFYFPNVVKQGPLRLTSITLGAATLALSTVVSLVHLDSDTFPDKEITIGWVCSIITVCLAQPQLVEPATSIEFPTILRIPSKGALPEFTLLGVGVRVVSFLRIKVYAAALYADLTNPNLKVTVYFDTSSPALPS